MITSYRQKRWARRMTGAVIAIAGAMLSYLPYAMSENADSLFRPFLLFGMLTAAVISFSIFSACLRLLRSAATAFLIGTLGSYLSFGILVFLTVAAGEQKEFAEAIMWMPLWIAFGVPFMGPLVGCAWVGSIVVFGEAPEDNSPRTHY